MTVFFHENGIKIVFGSLKSINHFFLALYFKLMVYENCCSDTLAIRSEAFFHLSVVGIFHNVPPQRHLLKRNSHIHALKIQHKTLSRFISKYAQCADVTFALDILDMTYRTSIWQKEKQTETRLFSHQSENKHTSSWQSWLRIKKCTEKK